MQRIKLKRDEPRYIQSRKYDWRELDELIGQRELVEIECGTPEEARKASFTLLHAQPCRDGVFTVRKSGSVVIVDARGGDGDGR